MVHNDQVVCIVQDKLNKEPYFWHLFYDGCYTCKNTSIV